MLLTIKVNVPCNNSESSLHAEKSEPQQKQGLQQVYVAIFHPRLYTFTPDRWIKFQANRSNILSA